MSQVMNEYLALTLEQNEAVQRMQAAAATLVRGGTEGVQVVAASHPELILATVVHLVDALTNQQNQINYLVEVQAEYHDFLDYLSSLK